MKTEKMQSYNFGTRLVAKDNSKKYTIFPAGLYRARLAPKIKDSGYYTAVERVYYWLDLYIHISGKDIKGNYKSVVASVKNRKSYMIMFE